MFRYVRKAKLGAISPHYLVGNEKYLSYLYTGISEVRGSKISVNKKDIDMEFSQDHSQSASAHCTIVMFFKWNTSISVY